MKEYIELESLIASITLLVGRDYAEKIYEIITAEHGLNCSDRLTNILQLAAMGIKDTNLVYLAENHLETQALMLIDFSSKKNKKEVSKDENK